jgi:hypothetical protein
VDASPITSLLASIDRLDVEGTMSAFAPDARMLATDGRRAQGIDAVRELIAEILSQLRATKHEVTAQWHQNGVWIAEVDATYELRDYMQTSPLPRAMFLREGPDGIADLHVYGAHERSLGQHRPGEQGMWVGERWIPPL